MCAELLTAKFELFLSNMIFFIEKNVLHFEDKQLAQLLDLCEQTKDLIHYTNQGWDCNQMWSIKRDCIYHHLVQDFFQIIKDSISKF
jgi:hypothetical protein